MKIKSPLSFILKKNLVEFEIVNKNGARFLVAGEFKQLIKESEYQKILAHEVKTAEKTTMHFRQGEGKK